MERKLMQWVEIDRSALVQNLGHFRRLAGKRRKLLAVVKANAYGHGLVEVSKVALHAGVDWLGVHSLEEGLCLRQNGIHSPVLVAGYIPLDGLEDAVTHDLRCTVYNTETLVRLARISQRLRKKAYVHIKVETGTHRQGIREEDLLPFINKIRECSHLIIEGISSHFANIEDTTDHSYARQQLANFHRMLRSLEDNNMKIPLRHMSCSASAILFPETYFDMVRIGIGMYGLWPSKETYLSSLLQRHQPFLLKPVLTWKARIAQIKKVPKGSYIGYGCTYRTNRDTLLAVVPVGYSDGYRRSLSNSSYVLVKNSRAELRGRVAMNFIMVDVTDIPGVRLEEEVVLLGKGGEEIISADYLASLVGTINYEIVAGINPLVPRILV
ncbi:MAG: alanine racemase [Candidatus Aminicenantales bacterium]